MKFSLLINMKMPTIVGIFIFISRDNFMLSYVEHEKSFITSGTVSPAHISCTVFPYDDKMILNMKKRTFGHVRPTKTPINMRVRAV